jgi:phosphoribosylcarboxyaminoimidazole (NCAIR) mutase
MSDELHTHKIIVDVAKGTTERIPLTAAQIRELRNRLLAETDYLATADNTMSDAMKTYRQNLRNVPQDYDASKYDELLEKNAGIGWKHSVWKKPS